MNMKSCDVTVFPSRRAYIFGQDPALYKVSSSTSQRLSMNLSQPFFSNLILVDLDIVSHDCSRNEKLDTPSNRLNCCQTYNMIETQQSLNPSFTIPCFQLVCAALYVDFFNSQHPHFRLTAFWVCEQRLSRYFLSHA